MMRVLAERLVNILFSSVLSIHFTAFVPFLHLHNVLSLHIRAGYDCQNTELIYNIIHITFFQISILFYLIKPVFTKLLLQTT